MKSNLVLAVGFCLLASSAAGAHEEHHHHHGSEMAAGPALEGESVYNLNSTWMSQDAKEKKLSELRGKPTVVAMTYTSCEAACPIIIEDMKKIGAGLGAGQGKDAPQKFSFLIFSLDSERDTAEKLKAFASKKKLDLAQWTLFRGDAKAVRDLAAALGIRYKRDKNGDFDHSNVITLLDSEGRIQHQQNGLNQDPKDFLDKAKSLK